MSQSVLRLCNLYCMERAEKVKRLVLQGKSIRQIADTLGISTTTTQYWMRKMGVRTNYIPPERPYKCRCGEKDPEKFSKTKRFICTKCQASYNNTRIRQIKEDAVSYLGGKCVSCGFSGHRSAFDFHHINPKNKEGNFSISKHWVWKKLKKELDKCVLLCANCHRGVHSGDIKLQNKKLP